MQKLERHIEELRKINEEAVPEKQALIYVKENLAMANLIGTDIFGDNLDKNEVFKIYDKIDSALIRFGNKYGAQTQDGPNGGAGGTVPKPRKPRATGGVRG